MPDRTDQREAIATRLKDFQGPSFAESARGLFATLGYASDRRLPIATVSQFCQQLDPGSKITDRERESLAQLRSLHLLFQLTSAELDAHGDLLDDRTSLDATRIESYLFFAAELPPGHYTRTALSTLVRAINKPLPMPALVLFRHGESISLGLIHRRLSKRDTTRDVLEKVTLIKDIACADPIRAHLEILNDFALANLDADFGVANFVRLHEAWQKRLGSYALSNDFYREIADWYFWALHQVADGAIRLPRHCDTEQEKSLFLIRLLTRVIFCWFLVEKRLIPTDLFREHRLKTLLKDFTPSRDPRKPDTSPAYYRAILQNLFFGTLNMPPEQRAFRKRSTTGGRDQNYGITNLWRYETAFRNRADWEALAARIPFLNGGLFDCLDDKSGRKKDNFILDGFSDREDHGCHLPNDLFFGPERTVDLSPDYGEEDKRTARSKRAKVRGLIEILSRYKFTIEENTPLEEEIALDPELLGKVFENLLASYNEDTRTTARKALGAFYTPREIVSYMVDEALKSYLKTSVAQTILSGPSLKPFNRDAPTAKTHRNLPHWTQEGTTYWITFRLADSLPAAKLKAWQEEKAIWLAHNPEPWSDDQWKEYDERFGQRLEEWLDAGEGECHLRRPDVRSIVERCLLHFDGQRYDVPAWVIMPNHVHLLLRPRPGFDLPKIMQGIKGVSAKECNALLGRTGQPFWQDESFDHIVRSQAQFDRFVRYIADNPVKARLRDGEFSVAQTILSEPGRGTGNPACASGSQTQTILSEPGRGTGNPACASGSQTQTGLSGPLSRQIDDLFSNKATLKEIKPDTRDALIAAIGRVKILDPACGSGAFPMGALHRLVDLLQKLDPNNESWKRDRLAEARRYRQLLEQSGTDNPVCALDGKTQTGLSGLHSELAACDARIADIEKSFDTRYHALDFARKLYLIENCIYGVDIQPIATQIAKLRFFISLVVDQKVAQTILSGPQQPTDNPVCDSGEETRTGLSGLPWNLGIRPLPNLETKFVAADTLIPLPQPKERQGGLFDGASPEDYAEHNRLKTELTRVRHEHFNARDPRSKRRCRDEDERIRSELRELLKRVGLPGEAAKAMAAWDPYDQNTFAPFFDSEWMFGLKGSPDNPVWASAKAQAGLPVPHSQGPFDIVIGNPPYIRIQTLKQKDPKLVAFYKDHYASAAKGNYDIYVVFIEAGLRLLKSDGHLAYICPHKFFNAQYGEPIREVIANGKHLRHVVHFGDEQVFPGATIYSCLLFLARAGATDCRFVKAHDLDAWKASGAGTEGKIAAGAISTSEWNFAVGKGAELFDLLNTGRTKLAEVADCFVGLQTSADDVFILQLIEERRDTLICFSKALQKEVEIERHLLHPIVSGTDIKCFAPLPGRQFILFPYSVREERASLMSFSEIRSRCGQAAAYLSKNRIRLEEREGGKFADSEWYRFGRSQNLGIQQRSKLCVPRLVDHLHAGIDLQGTHYLDNVDVGGVTWKPRVAHRSLKTLCALLNSQVLRWFFPHVSAPFRGGFRSANRQFLEQLPICEASPHQERPIDGLVDILLCLNSYFATHPASQTTRDPLMVAYWERVLNGLVYELYFPEELHAAGLRLFDLVARAGLPSVEQTILSVRAEGKSKADTDKIVCATLRQKFEELHDGAHPLRLALDKLQTLDTVRIIEGQA